MEKSINKSNLNTLKFFNFILFISNWKPQSFFIVGFFPMCLTGGSRCLFKTVFETLNEGDDTFEMPRGYPEDEKEQPRGSMMRMSPLP